MSRDKMSGGKTSRGKISSTLTDFSFYFVNCRRTKKAVSYIILLGFGKNLLIKFIVNRNGMKIVMVNAMESKYSTILKMYPILFKRHTLRGCTLAKGDCNRCFHFT